MTNTETSSIDDKKSDSTTKDYTVFLKTYGYTILKTVVFSVFIIGTLGLYTTKVAQANILPDNPDQAPYGIFDRIIKKDILIDAHIMRNFLSENKDTLSQKIVFDSRAYLDSYNNSFLCKLKESAKPGVTLATIPLYLSPVYDNIIAHIFSAINTIFFYLSFLPESIVMLVYGLGYVFIWTAIFIYALLCSVYYHVANIPQLFREKSSHDGLDTMSDNDPNIETIKNLDNNKWESEKNITLLRFWKIILFFCCFYPIMFSMFLSPIVFTIYGFFAPLYATYKINKTDKTEGIYDFIKNTFKFKKLFFYILATVTLFSNTIQYLGSPAALAVTIAVLIAWFIGLYTIELPEAGINGFTTKIRETPIQATVEKLDILKQVDICVIPTADDAINNIITDSDVSLRKFGGSESELKTVSFDSKINYISPVNNNVSSASTSTSASNADNLEYNNTDVDVEEPILVGGKKMKRKYNKKFNIKFA